MKPTGPSILPPPTAMKSAKRRNPGFTMTELLVTISIIIILAVIVFTASRRIINSAQKAVCVQNLHGIGNAIQAYCMENGNRLPGPLNVGQSALFNPKAPSPGPQLVHYIGPFLETERDHDKPYLISNFGCPSLLSKLNTTNKQPPIVYRMGHDDAEHINGNRGFPWIWNDPAGTAGRIPWRIDQIASHSAGKVYAMIEQDQTMGGSWTNNGANMPAHGKERMALFFDWSVKGVPVSQWRR